MRALEHGAVMAHPRMCFYDSVPINFLAFGLAWLRDGHQPTACNTVWAKAWQQVGGYPEDCNPILQSQETGTVCPEMVRFAENLAARYGWQRIRLLPMLMATSARRFKRFGLASQRTFSVPVRQDWDRLIYPAHMGLGVRR